MNKEELVTSVIETNGKDIAKNRDGDVNHAAALRIVNSVLKTIEDAVISGENVELSGFGTFTTSERQQRNGRNPYTGESITIPSMKVPKFRASKKFKDAINASSK